MNFRFLPNTIKKLSKVNTEKVVCPVRKEPGWPIADPSPCSLPSLPHGSLLLLLWPHRGARRVSVGEE